MGTHLEGYFDYLGSKTYINKYPQSILSLDELRGATILEIGAGVFNDLLFLVNKGITSVDSIMLSEPYIPSFCDGLDKIENLTDQSYAFAHRYRISYVPFPNPELRSNTINFIYANNVLHSLGYSSLSEDLEKRLFAEKGIGDPKRIKQLQQPPIAKIKQVLEDAYRVLTDGGIFFGRNLANFVNEIALRNLKEKEIKTSTDEFALWTAEAVLHGPLIGLSPQEFSQWAVKAGFSKIYTEVEQPDPVKPRINFYFRFQK